MRNAYLTIDDTPSPHTDALTDFLVSRNVPAILYVRGDMMEQHGTQSVVRAIQKGFVIGNHLYNHYRSSEISFEDVCAEILQTQKMIDACYAQAGTNQPLKLIRFPHLDRGSGGWIVNYDAYDEPHRSEIIKLFSDGINIDLKKPSEELFNHQRKIARFLKEEGFVPAPFNGVTLPWYRGEVAESIDALYTYSTSDWMLLDRHKGKWPYKTLDDLKRKIDEDKNLNDPTSAQIILGHDKDEIENVLPDLVDHLLRKQFNFKGVA
jgi:peptidoglycan-N-acetylglucosamine deacetylase